MATPPKKVSTGKPTVAERERLKREIARERAKIKSWSIKELIRAMQAYRTQINKTGKAEILEVKLSKTAAPYLIVNSQVRGTKLWQQTLHFPATIVSDVPSDVTPFQIDMGHGNYKFIAQLSGDDPVMLRCSCPDYRHSFSWENYDVKSLQGKRIPYNRVPGSNRPPRNPDHIPGICKHLRAVIFELQKKGGNWQIIAPFPESNTTAVAGYLWRK